MGEDSEKVEALLNELNLSINTESGFKKEKTKKYDDVDKNSFNKKVDDNLDKEI